MTGGDAVKILNELILTSQNGEKGFNEAADIAEDAQLKAVFRDCAGKCQAATGELQARVMALDGDPPERGSVAGAAHRGWIKVKSAVENSNISVLEEVERGEDHAKAVYAKSLKAQLPSDLRALVQRQYEGVLATHDRIRQLRDQYRARA